MPDKEMNRLKRALADQRMGSPEDDFAYGEGISEAVSLQSLMPAVEFGLSMAPGSGEAMALRDAWDHSGVAGESLLDGRYYDAASGYADMLSALAGTLPGAGLAARATKRGTQWTDRNLPKWLKEGYDTLYRGDPNLWTLDDNIRF